MSELPETPIERRVLLDEMSEIHSTLDAGELALFEELAAQVAVDDDEAIEAEVDFIQTTREVESQ